MAPATRTLAAFDQLRRCEGWTRVVTLDGVDAARAYTAGAEWLRAPELRQRLTTCLDEAQAMARAALSNPVALTFDREGGLGHLTLVNPRATIASTWDFDIPSIDAIHCLQKLGDLAARAVPGCRLTLLPQRSRSHQWRMTLIHPTQAAGAEIRAFLRTADRDGQPMTLEQLCQKSTSKPVPMTGLYATRTDTCAASVEVNHLDESVHLFRLLVRYDLFAEQPPTEARRADLDHALAALIHDGDPRRTGWFRNWLGTRMADLALRIDGLNGNGPRHIILDQTCGQTSRPGTSDQPKGGRNGRAAQLLIDPDLPVDEWYDTLARLHDLLLVAFEEYQAEFTALLGTNAILFYDYLQQEAAKPVAAPAAGPMQNEVGNVCEARLIEITVPRRGSAPALSAWYRIAGKAAIGAARDDSPELAGMNDLQHTLAQARMAILAPDTRNPALAVTQLVEAVSAHGAAQSCTLNRRLLPRMADRLDAAAGPSTAIFALAGAQFIAAHDLAHDPDLAALLDHWLAEAMTEPPALSQSRLSALEQKDHAPSQWVAAINHISDRMLAHARMREGFLATKFRLLNGLIRDLEARIGTRLRAQHGQIWIAGGYATRLHAAVLGRNAAQLDPLCRISLHVQHGGDDIFPALECALRALLPAGSMLEISPDRRDASALELRWREPLRLADGTRYRPVILTLYRRPVVDGPLPALASIQSLPVLDLRLLAEEYCRKGITTAEPVMRRIISSTHEALLDMIAIRDLGLVGRAFGDSEI